ncbi:nitroreductase/quinone reductase family protein [Actinophytocola sediminis]
MIADAGGAARHPAWFHDLVAEPRVVVEDGVFVYDAHATVLDDAARDAAFARAVEADPVWGEYQRGTSRVIPVVTLRRLTPGPPNASTVGAGILLAHDAFRRELRLVRAEVAGSGSTLGAQLRVNCLTLCAVLDLHHHHEDTRTFAALDTRHPELTDTLVRLRAEHELMAARLGRLRDAVNSGKPDLLTDVDQLVAELEAHLDFEERHIIPLLDTPTGPPTRVQDGFSAPLNEGQVSVGE